MFAWSSRKADARKARQVVDLRQFILERRSSPPPQQSIRCPDDGGRGYRPAGGGTVVTHGAPGVAWVVAGVGSAAVLLASARDAGG